MIIMALVFAVVYPITISRVGFEYNGKILVPIQENSRMVYSGKIQGQQAHFIVSEDKTIVFQHGDRIYGPYIAKEDPTAIPKDREMQEYMTGVELRQGEEVLFRGGVLETGDSYWLYNEDGTLDDFVISYVTSDGIERDENGNVIDPIEPSDLEIAGRYIGWTVLTIAALVLFIMGLQ
uniref:hypothetical protein n=1 Tax=Agathobacter sp. TaxID=2021311 RepID=UPI0040560E36